jgi:uncharacterized membrane protein HdeD (DUF308 family)
MRSHSQNLIKLPKNLNFVLGVILISSSLVYMVSEQRFSTADNIEPLLLLITGVLSLFTALSFKPMTGVFLNLILGCFFIIMGIILSITFKDDEWSLTSTFGLAMGDLFLNIFLGLILIILSFMNKNVVL